MSAKGTNCLYILNVTKRSTRIQKIFTASAFSKFTNILEASFLLALRSAILEAINALRITIAPPANDDHAACKPEIATLMTTTTSVAIICTRSILLNTLSLLFIIMIISY